MIPPLECNGRWPRSVTAGRLASKRGSALREHRYNATVRDANLGKKRQNSAPEQLACAKDFYKTFTGNLQCADATPGWRDRITGVMKPSITSQSTRTAFVLAAALIAAATTLVAQTPSPKKPEAPPQGDPFINKGAERPGAAERRSFCNLGMILETYSLDQADAARLIGENQDGQAFYNQVRELVKQGKARFENVLGNVTQSGKRSALEQIDEVRYAAGYRADLPTDKTPVPTGFLSRNTGDTFEWEPQLAPDNRSCNLVFMIQKIRLRGFENLSDPNQPKALFAQPRFETQRVTSSETVGAGVMQFLGTFSAPPQVQGAEPKTDEKAAPQVKLLFGRLDVADIAVPNPQASQAGGNLELRLSFYSLDRENARAILADIPKPGAVYAALQPLLERHQAKLERLLVLKTSSGLRSTAEEIEELSHLGKTASKPDDKGVSPDNKNDKPAGSYAEFSTRTAGLTFDVEPVLDPNISVVDINLAPQIVRVIGDLKGQPVFETRKISTCLSTPLGEQAFIGTFSPPADTGANMEKGTGQVWLGFVRVNVVRPY